MFNQRMKYGMSLKFWFVVTLLSIQTEVCELESLEPGRSLSKFDYDYKVIQKLSQLEQEIKELKQRKTCEDGQKVAFMAQLSGALQNPPMNTVVVFDSVHTNAGNGYNSRSGIFVAPVNGLYSINVVASSRTKKAREYLHLYIMHNTSQVGYIFLDQNSDYSLMRSTSIVLQLHVGDTVFVRIGNIARGYLEGCCFHTIFSGFLII